jgi:hypothetical protein
MPGAKKGHDQRAQAEAHPFHNDISAFGRELEQKREADCQIKEAPTER